MKSRVFLFVDNFRGDKWRGAQKRAMGLVGSFVSHHLLTARIILYGRN
jgi:hypothetical protein